MGGFLFETEIENKRESKRKIAKQITKEQECIIKLRDFYENRFQRVKKPLTFMGKFNRDDDYDKILTHFVYLQEYF